MTRPYRHSIEHPLPGVSPEHLLLLTIFGSSKARRQIDAELDRRAATRRPHIRTANHAGQLLPAA